MTLIYKSPDQIKSFFIQLSSFGLDPVLGPNPKNNEKDIYLLGLFNVEDYFIAEIVYVEDFKTFE